jgi:predicted acyltransferase
MTTQRFTALDVFRGMTICFMIIVNTPGNGNTTYAPLLHAHWHGFTPTDLVFPSFLFAVGNALSFVMPKWNNLPAGMVVTKILKRTFIIFLLGFLMYWFPFVKQVAGEVMFAPFNQTRVFGVLQRIALCYGIAALMLYFLKPKLTIIISTVMLLLYWLILLLFSQGDPFSMEGNAGILLDKWLLGEGHMYHGEGVAFDPEGLLSTMTAVSNVVAGFAVGSFIQKQGKTYQMLTKLLLAGAALMAIAWSWNYFFPVNKKLWTSSFVLLTVGLDCIIISAIIYIIDFLHKTRWTYFFEVLGRNPLFIYLLSELGVTLLYVFSVHPKVSVYKWLYDTIYANAGAYFGSLLFAVSVMLLCWLAGYFMDKKKIYVKV